MEARHKHEEDDDDAQKIITCALCRQTYQEPKCGFAGNACGHAFCCVCLRDYINRGQLKCPTCRAELTIKSADQVDGLPTQSFLQQRADDYRILHPNATNNAALPKVHCIVCGEQASKQCFQCDTKLCEKHANKHQQHPKFKTHEVSGIRLLSHTLPTYCVLHPEQLITTCCLDCCVFLCETCCSAHKDHRLDKDVHTALPKLHARASEDIEEILALKDSVAQALATAQRNIFSITQHYETQRESIQAYFDMLIVYLSNMRRQRVDELTEAHLNRYKPLKSSIDALHILQLTQLALETLPQQTRHNMGNSAALLQHTLQVARQPIAMYRADFWSQFDDYEACEKIDAATITGIVPKPMYFGGREALQVLLDPTSLITLNCGTTMSPDRKTVTKVGCGHESVSTQGIIGMNCPTEMRVQYTPIYAPGWTVFGVYAPPAVSCSAVLSFGNPTFYGVIVGTKENNTVYIDNTYEAGSMRPVQNADFRCDPGAIIRVRVDEQKRELTVNNEASNGWMHTIKLPVLAHNAEGWRFHISLAMASFTLL